MSQICYVNLIAYFEISWSRCKDSQTSADTEEAGINATGAMSLVSKLIYLSLYYGGLYLRSNYVYIICYRYGNFYDVGGNPQQCYQQLLVDIREILENRNLRCVIRVLFFNNKFSSVGMTFLK